jgi:PAS domain S-box-containing protein
VPADPALLLHHLMKQDRDNAIILMDPAGVIVDWLAGAEPIFGYTLPEALGRYMGTLFTPEDVSAGVPEHELDVARSDGRADDDRWLMRKDGGRFWAHGTTVALHDEARNIMGFGKILRDRTEVRAQILAIQNDLLATQEAKQRIEGFVTLLAHELRNPLSVIATNAASLAALTTAPASTLVSSTASQCRFMTRMVQDLQDTIRAGEGMVAVNREDVILQDVLSMAADSVRPHAEKRNQSFHVILLPAPIRIHVDSDRIRQAVTNLLENAVKYTPEGGSIWLKFSIEGAEAVIRVEDNGMGIDKDALPDLFELFTRPRRNAAANHQLGAGLGLGLPLVKELVALHGGTVQVRSAGSGKGAEFVLRLPLPDGTDSLR